MSLEASATAEARAVVWMAVEAATIRRRPQKRPQKRPWRRRFMICSPRETDRIVMQAVRRIRSRTPERWRMTMPGMPI